MRGDTRPGSPAAATTGSPHPARSATPAVSLAVAAALLAAAAPAAAQGTGDPGDPAGRAPGDTAAARAGTAAAGDTTPRAVSPDSADRLRAKLVRPPSEPPFDALDAVALPFRVATYPLTLLGEAVGAGLDLIAGAGPPPFYLRFYRTLSAWGLDGGVGSIGPRSGPAVEMELVRWEPAYLRTAWSVEGSQDHEAGLRWSGEAGRLSLAAGFHRDAEPRLWGLGPRSSTADRTSFEHDRVHATLRGELETLGPLTLGLVAGYEENQVEDGSDDASPPLGEALDTGELFGARERTHFARLGTRAVLDLTYRDGFQNRGLLSGAAADLFRGTGPTDADFHRLRGWTEAYLPANDRQTLALRAEVEVNDGDSGRGVPFTHMPTLGDAPGGRAYEDGRFRAADLVAATAEWRWEVWRELQGRMRAEGFVFFEEGTVVSDLSAVSGSDLRPSWGGGLRIVGRDGMQARAFLADGEEGARVQFDFSARF